MEQNLRNKIKKIIISLLEYHSEEKISLLFANLLLRKLNTEEDINFSVEEITDFLFKKNSNEINETIFECLRDLNIDLSEINFDGKKIKGLCFSGLKGVVINIDKVPDKDLSGVKFDGVTLIGTLNDAIIENTDFKGYLGNLRLDPQTIRNKSIEGASLSGIVIDGNFDNIVITGVDFSEARGNIVINPQNVPDKKLIDINFSNVLLCNTNNENSIDSTLFSGCRIESCKFRNIKSPIVINLDTLAGSESVFPKLPCCDLTDVCIVGHTKSHYDPVHCVAENGTIIFENVEDDLYGSYYYDENGNLIDIYLYESMMWNDNKKCWVYVPRNKEQNLKFDVEFKKTKSKEKSKILSLLKKK